MLGIPRLIVVFGIIGLACTVAAAPAYVASALWNLSEDKARESARQAKAAKPDPPKVEPPKREPPKVEIDKPEPKPYTRPGGLLKGQLQEIR
jgi:hypothetical protein